MSFYALASECHYFLGTSTALDQYPLPLWEIAFERTGKLLRIEYKNKLFVLGISNDGTLQGFRGNPKNGCISDLVILKISPFDFRIFERRFIGDVEIERKLSALALPQADPANGMFSCGFLDYQKNLEGYSIPNPACPSGMPGPSAPGTPNLYGAQHPQPYHWTHQTPTMALSTPFPSGLVRLILLGSSKTILVVLSPREFALVRLAMLKTAKN